MNKKGFTLVELIVSFVLITIISLAFFKTILTLQEQQVINIAKNKYKAFNVVLNNAIQKDFLNDKVKKIASCGVDCYEITYVTKGNIKLKIDMENNTIEYGSIKEKLPSSYKFFDNVEFTMHNSDEEGFNSFILLTLPIKSNLESNLNYIKYMYQYDSNKNPMEIDIETTMVSEIIRLYSSEETRELNGLIKDNTEEQNIRYAGSTPNNYIYFNCSNRDSNGLEYGSNNYNYTSSCETWRIIGVFDVKQDESGISEKRIKIIRNTLDAPMAWDTKGINQWGETTYTSDNTTIYPGSSLMQYLNGNAEGNYYYSLSSIAKGQMGDALWYTGAVSGGENGPNETLLSYIEERSNLTGSATTINYTTTWTGKIGLIYRSDFQYAEKTSNWLTAVDGYNWTISPFPNTSDMTWLDSYGILVTNTGGVRPTLYLNSDVLRLGGDGTVSNPYRIISN